MTRWSNALMPVGVVEKHLCAPLECCVSKASKPSGWERAIAQGTAGEEAVGNALTALSEEMNLGVLRPFRTFAAASP